jgi:hypothetical protein
MAGSLATADDTWMGGQPAQLLAWLSTDGAGATSTAFLSSHVECLGPRMARHHKLVRGDQRPA